MDEVTFKSDTVLSDVHLYTPNQRHLMVRLNGMGQPVFLSQFKLLWSRDSWTHSGAEDSGPRDVATQETSPAGSESGHSHEDLSLQAGDDITIQERLNVPLDEDGDLDVVRRPRAASDPNPAEPARNKVWRGALFLADYILFRRDLFQGCTVLELGAGTGLASIVAATMAHTVYCTDVGTDLLTMCQRNVALNSHLAATGDGVIKVKELDWLKDDLCTDPKVPFSWSEEDVRDMYDHTTVLFAAEVFYDDDLTDALFNTLSRLVHRLKNACTAILSVEKRFNFTLRHLDVTCEAYDHFRASLDSLEKLADGRLRFMVEPVEASFPQLLIYERIRQLELWKIRVEPTA
ncbi:methyltransferase-like protein 22 isoform X2 [Cricetulus griseus]|uniref:Methyltransferase-like protein 22 isoform X2 n=1 Tax=Cricetulus griseus TaxID=10029 RepID=A0A9J7GBD8_CRIGR|nr:methyltransferase-like protein 22 isoform X2 [Cricetulus griseus]XP_027279732.1 methyltransferase-like protein 22 isoform X2 [Cricetulus griseus]